MLFVQNVAKILSPLICCRHFSRRFSHLFTAAFPVQSVAKVRAGRNLLCSTNLACNFFISHCLFYMCILMPLLDLLEIWPVQLPIDRDRAPSEIGVFSCLTALFAAAAPRSRNRSRLGLHSLLARRIECSGRQDPQLGGGFCRPACRDRCRREQLRPGSSSRNLQYYKFSQSSPSRARERCKDNRRIAHPCQLQVSFGIRSMAAGRLVRGIHRPAPLARATATIGPARRACARALQRR